ncbi:MAG: hypothetical protein PHE25_02890 [Candidatus Gracilibacteria bacterium]|nr:hypothetical protein [Candidatus Gracilibacteria bacterium]
MTTMDLKKISVYNFLEIINSKGIISQYFNDNPEIEVDYFDDKEEKEIINSSEFISFKSIVDKKFVGR